MVVSEYQLRGGEGQLGRGQVDDPVLMAELQDHVVLTRVGPVSACEQNVLTNHDSEIIC